MGVFLTKGLSEHKTSIADSLILIVDDDPINSTVIHNLLATTYKAHVVESGEQALDFCATNLPDLILLDVMMGGISGLETCKRLKNSQHTQHIPVVFITSILDQDSENRCWDAGGVDFVSKPVNGITLLNRIKSHLTLKLQADFLRRMTFIDGLTGLYNRHLLSEVISKGILHTNRSGSPFSLMMIDVDWFKAFNDTYGHLVGDDCLRGIANAIRQTLHRPTDVAMRFGGEEFLCFLPQTDIAGAKHIAAKLLKVVEGLGLPHKSSPFGVTTISIGICTVDPHTNKNNRQIIGQADSALYKAKQSGRNRFVHQACDTEQGHLA